LTKLYSEEREFEDDLFEREVTEGPYGGEPGRMPRSGFGRRKTLGRPGKALGRVASAGVSEYVLPTFHSTQWI
jgi:hypothetical protein